MTSASHTALTGSLDQSDVGVSDVSVVVAGAPVTSVAEVVRTAVNSVFSVGLDLCSARALVDGEAAERIDRAVSELDSMIAQLRSGIYELAVTDGVADRSPLDL